MIVRLTQLVTYAIAIIVGSSSAFAQADRSVEVVLDVSSSMAQDLPSGPEKITAAKEAVVTFVKNLPPATRLALRAYGHQSPDREKDCRDTRLEVEFAPVPAVERMIIRQTRRLTPRGYSPISLALERAAEDISDEPAPTKMVVLVSDGKETCSGDPCAAAKALMKVHPDLVIHSIGFNVGKVARQQLQCTARAGGGKYFDAQDAPQLAQRLQEAYATMPEKTREVIVVNNPEPGILTITNPTDKHMVRGVESGEILTAIAPSRPSALVPPGIYNVTFGNGVWKSIEVKSGEETTLDPGRLKIENPSVLGHPIIDAATNEVITEITPARPSVTLVPDKVAVNFGKSVWSDVIIKNGRETVLQPGVIKIEGASLRGSRMRRHPIYDATGAVVGKLSLSHPRVPLPPGKYTVDVLGRQLPVDLTGGQVVVLQVN